MSRADIPLAAPCSQNANAMDVYDIRYKNLRQLLGDDAITTLADKLERDPSLISHYLAHDKRVGARFARHVETRLGLAKGWMDTPHPGQHTPYRLITAVERYLATSPDPAVADTIALLLEQLTPTTQKPE